MYRYTPTCEPEMSCFNSEISCFVTAFHGSSLLNESFREEIGPTMVDLTKNIWSSIKMNPRLYGFCINKHTKLEILIT